VIELTYRSGPEERRNPADSVDDAGAASPSLGEPTLPGNETVPVWAMASICLGLVALTGSALVICLAGTAIVLGWMVRSAGREDGANRVGLNGLPGPFHSVICHRPAVIRERSRRDGADRG
jgi:hypothetical protein